MPLAGGAPFRRKVLIFGTASVVVFLHVVQSPSMVGTGHLAVHATQALLIVYKNNAILALDGSFGRANSQTCRVFTVHARPWEELAGDIGVFTNLIIIYPVP